MASNAKKAVFTYKPAKHHPKSTMTVREQLAFNQAQVFFFKFFLDLSKPSLCSIAYVMIITINIKKFRLE